MKSIGIIPARYASTRFPGKPLVEIMGKTMIQRVFEQAQKTSLLDEVWVATDDERIFNRVKTFTGNVFMSNMYHKSGTDRCAELAKSFDEDSIVVNIQGDEPFIDPRQIDELVQFMKETSWSIGTQIKELTDKKNLFNPNVVKVVFDKNSKALYFSRNPIPFQRNIENKEEWLRKGKYYRHIGLYAFRHPALLAIAALSPSALEESESLEQLRWLENGYEIGVTITNYNSQGIDTPEDLEALNK